MGFRIDVRIGADGDARLRSQPAGSFDNQVGFGSRLHIQKQDVGFQREPDLGGSLAWTIEDDFTGGTGRLQYTEEFASGDDFKPGSPFRETTEDVDIGVRLDGVAGEVRYGLECFFKDADVTAQRAFAVYIGGRANFIGNTLKRNFLAVETAAAIVKMMHSGNYSWKRKTGNGSRIKGGAPASIPGIRMWLLSTELATLGSCLSPRRASWSYRA